MRILGLIPARGGSKGVPRKNIKLLAGKPLLAYTAEAARAAKSLSAIVVSTEDPEIAEVARALGLDVPFSRPRELAEDSTPTLPVVQHALSALAERGQSFDAVCLLQPTDPFRTMDDIEACIALMQSTHADSVVSVLEVPTRYNPHWTYFMREDGSLELATGGIEPIPRRQALPPAFHRSGSIYLVRTRTVLAGSLFGERCVGYQVSADKAVNIDAPEDWELAERILAQGSS